MADDRNDDVVEIQLNGYQVVKAKGRTDRDSTVVGTESENVRSRPSSNWWYQCFECFKTSDKTQFIPIQGNDSEMVLNEINHQPGALLRDKNANENYGSS